MMRSAPVLLALLLARILLAPELIAQQTDTSADPGRGNLQEVRGVELEQNYPNPFSTETRIPFRLGSDLFEDGRTVVVSVRIFNVLRQLVAVPTTDDGTRALELQYDLPGLYTLRWDGRDMNGELVSSGVYFCQIVANGLRGVRKMIVIR